MRAETAIALAIVTLVHGRADRDVNDLAITRQLTKMKRAGIRLHNGIDLRPSPQGTVSCAALEFLGRMVMTGFAHEGAGRYFLLNEEGVALLRGHLVTATGVAKGNEIHSAAQALGFSSDSLFRLSPIPKAT